MRLINTQQPQAKVIVLVRPWLCLCCTGSHWVVLGGQSLGLSSALCLPSLAWLCRSFPLALPELVDSLPVTIALLNVAEEVL